MLSSCEHGRTEIISALLSVSGHSIIHTSTGDNILHAAVSSQVPETVRLIVEVRSAFLGHTVNKHARFLQGKE